ncbi:speckle-type POZ protein B [Nephila pilipes]|uniref:Speckle-type POZ protein B n=1 Tax=Nephila pilipes TaxID=299642 RepID=A0A8X6NGT6_NEPPI|nr:speckle-type POZ protein B [Nephila pilipes]
MSETNYQALLLPILIYFIWWYSNDKGERTGIISKQCEVGEFQFFWSIEKFILTESSETTLVSPPFSVGTSAWRLQLDLKSEADGSYFAIYLKREERDLYPHPINVEYALSFWNSDFKSEKSRKWEVFSFSNGTGRGWPKFAKYQEVLSHTRNNFFELDKLSVGCHMKMCKNIVSTSSMCFARTLLDIDMNIFVWKIERFSALKPNKKMTTQSTAAAGSVLSISVFLSDMPCSEMKINIIPKGKRIRMSTCKVSVLNAHGMVADSVEDTMVFDTNKIWDFPLFLMKKKLLEKKNLYLPQDVLTLKFECTMFLGIAYESIELYKYQINS